MAVMIRRLREHGASGKGTWNSSFGSRASSDARNSSYMTFFSEIIVDGDIVIERGFIYVQNGVERKQEDCVIGCGQGF